jgi:endonuclease III
VTSPDPARRLHAALRRIRAVPSPIPSPFPDSDPLLHLFVESFLIWEASTPLAADAIDAIAANLVDYNELRVCYTEEIAELLGSRYPRAQERSARLRCALNDLFKREHALSLAHLHAQGRRDQRGYLESLEGTPPYVAARVALLGLGIHALPVDARLLTLLNAEGCCPTTDSCEALSAWLEKQFKPAEAPDAHARLQAWSDARGDHASRGTTRPRRKTAPKPRSRDHRPRSPGGRAGTRD